MKGLEFVSIRDDEQLALDFGVNAVAIQNPQRKLKHVPVNPITQEQLATLENRRAGIKPIISHLKKYWQIGRSRMKFDKTTGFKILDLILTDDKIFDR